MSEEIKKEVQDAELNPEELDKAADVAGGCCGGIARSLGDDGYVCQKCNEMLSFNDVEVR